MKASLPGKKVSASQAPKVFVSLTPAELILLQGEPSYLAVQGAKQLLWVSNTDSDVFRMGMNRARLLPGRGPLVLGARFHRPWTFATPNLPADFKQIPLEHARSRVLASVPGTDEAIEGVLLAQIPQTARVSKTLKAPEVAYQGAPEFQPIEKTTVQRAVNTDKDILKVGDLYYMCFQGVWFMSTARDRPVGGDGQGAEADLRDSGQLAGLPRHLRHGRGSRRRRRRLCDGDGVHRSDGRVGLRRVGHRLLLPAVRRITARIRSTTRTIRPTGTARSTTRGPARTRAARWPTVRTAAPASARATTPDRHLLARRRGLGTLRRRGCRTGV